MIIHSIEINKYIHNKRAALKTVHLNLYSLLSYRLHIIIINAT